MNDYFIGPVRLPLASLAASIQRFHFFDYYVIIESFCDVRSNRTDVMRERGYHM